MKILIVTDAWYPQVNGVVRTLDTLRREAERQGHTVEMVTPEGFTTVPLPSYPEIRLALFPGPKIQRIIDGFQPNAIHIATEGTLGWSARRVCLKRGFPFTTAFHTRFPEYVNARFHVPVSWGYRVIRRFHRPAFRVLAATEALRRELSSRGFGEVGLVARGVDTDLFRPGDDDFLKVERPVQLYVGRVAVEKNLRAFLDASVPGTKVVVGDGPQREDLSKAYPDVVFTGTKVGVELARYYAAADVFVFPSKTDTFGLVMLEALAAGVPVAAYPVPGPLDVVGARAFDQNCDQVRDRGGIDKKPVACLSDDLGQAIESALKLDRAACRDYACEFSWAACAQQFIANLVPVETVSPS